MTFTSFDFLLFLVVLLATYWLLPNKTSQNLLLLTASYLFYGYVHPWFCLLIAFSTVVDYCCGLAMGRFTQCRGWILGASLAANLGMLGVFKYFDFFAANIGELLNSLGWQVGPATLGIVLPVGISFYTFQTLSYTIDIYRGEMEPRRNFLDFALFVSFFPQLVAGPIERAKRFLPQIEMPRRWDWHRFYSAFPLLVIGFFKKLVVADNVAVVSDKVFMLEQPSLVLLFAGSLAFAVQILADFSAYTDIARGTARLFGFELIENFNRPYLATSPADFWRPWHISFSTWIRDYVYIPLGGSRVRSWSGAAAVLLVTMGLSGLWHGAAWNFVAWGIYHGLLIVAYRSLGLGSGWRPNGFAQTVAAWSVMSCLTLLGWLLFRAPSLGWLVAACSGAELGLTGDQLILGLFVIGFVLVHVGPWSVAHWLQRHHPEALWTNAFCRATLLVLIVTLGRESPSDFIYFQF